MIIGQECMKMLEGRPPIETSHSSIERKDNESEGILVKFGCTNKPGTVPNLYSCPVL